MMQNYKIKSERIRKISLYYSTLSLFVFLYTSCLNNKKIRNACVPALRINIYVIRFLVDILISCQNCPKGRCGCEKELPRSVLPGLALD